MVDENAILGALESKLEADATLRSYLKPKDGSSKILIGIHMPIYSPPMVQILIITNEIENVMTYSEITFRINAYSQGKTTGEPDLAELENILQRCNDLIHDQSLSVSNHGVFSMYTEGRDQPIPDLDHEGAFIQGLRCRMFAIKIR